LIQAYRNNLKHEQIEAELHKYKERLLIFDKATSLGDNFEFNHSPATLTKNGHTISLTKKELKLLEILVMNRNLPTHYSLMEKHIWENIVVGESSLRSLLRRLRKKLPELTIKTVSSIGYMLIIPD